jgi:hypothetical protein
MVPSTNLNNLEWQCVGKLVLIFAGVCAFILPAYGQVSVASCAEIQDSDARLSCYDEASVQAQNLPVIRLPRATVSPSSESSNISPGASENFTSSDDFGFEILGNVPRGTTRTYRVVVAKRNDFSGWRIEFDGGGTWSQTGTDSYDMEVGETYTLRRGFLGSYLLSNSRNNKKMRISRLK